MILEARNLTKAFGKRGSLLQRPTLKMAVDGVNFSVPEGKTVALVGESGSGKSTVGMMLLGLLDPTAGEIEFEGQTIWTKRGKPRQELKRKIQVVFQDPYASLNARMTVEEAITEGILIHRLARNPAEKI